MSDQHDTTFSSNTHDRAIAQARDEFVFAEKRRIETENRAKTERLRSLRLAQEAARRIC